MGGIEARLLFSLAALASAMLHIAVLVALEAGAPAPVQEVRIELATIKLPPPSLSAAPATEDAPSNAPAAAPLSPIDRWTPEEPMSAPAGASSARVDIGGGAGVVPERKVSWRRRMQEKEERHQARMAEKEAKLSVLNEATRQEANRSQAPSADVYRCGAEKNRHRPVQVYAERDVNRYVSIFPAGLFPTRYVEQMRELLGTPARGRWHFALPQGSLPIVLDAPSGVLLAAGRDDRRCVVGVDFTPRTFFPLRFLHVPLRIVDATDRVHSVVVDVELLDDGTFRLQRLSGDDLPMATGALYDHTTVGRNLKKHYAAARLLRDVAGFLVGDAP